MIYTERTVRIKGGRSSINGSILLHRGDRGVEVIFVILQNEFKFKKTENFITSTDAAYGQLIIKKPDDTKILSDVSECDDGKVIFLITKEMIDELPEVGFYDIQIRLYDSTKSSRITIPVVEKVIEIKEPLMVEDETVFVVYNEDDQELIFNDNVITYDAEKEELTISGLYLGGNNVE